MRCAAANDAPREGLAADAAEVPLLAARSQLKRHTREREGVNRATRGLSDSEKVPPSKGFMGDLRSTLPTGDANGWGYRRELSFFVTPPVICLPYLLSVRDCVALPRSSFLPVLLRPSAVPILLRPLVALAQSPSGHRCHMNDHLIGRGEEERSFFVRLPPLILFISFIMRAYIMVEHRNKQSPS